VEHGQTFLMIDPYANGSADAASPPSLVDRLLDTFGDLIDQRHGAIGRVVASEKEPSGSHQFCFWAGEEERDLDVGHIVVAFSEDAAVIGVVDEPRRYSDLRSFLDDFYDRHIEAALVDEPPTRRPEILVFVVRVLGTKHIRDDVISHRPAIAGPVFYATSTAIDFALGRANFDGLPIPALLHTNGNAVRNDDGNERLNEQDKKIFQRSPIWLDENYLLGPEAGHANWTGQSGLATKTSHALFLTSAIFQKLRDKPPDEHGQRTTAAALMFNVKGPDLLWLDKGAIPEPVFESAYASSGFRSLPDEDLEAYASIGMAPEPFSNLSIYAPFRPGQVPLPDGQSGVVSLAQGYHPQLNTARNYPGQTQCVYPILFELKQFLRQAHRVFERADLDDKMWGLISDLRDTHQISTIHQLDQLFKEIDEHFEQAEQEKSGDDANYWRGHHKFTLRKARNRFNSLEAKFGGLLARGAVDYGNTPKVDRPFSDQEIRVIDIASCNSNVQEMIVNRVIDDVWKRAERNELGVTKLIVFVDELNKYAARGGEGGLRDILVDIAARGRHLNVVLFGAQQFRSKVDDEILGNCGTSFYGRIGDEEITNSSYRSLSENVKADLQGLPKGRLLVRHAHFQTPLFGTFPRPPVIPGINGQRVFNNESGQSHPAEGLFKLLRQYGDQVAKQEVLTEAEGLSDAEINDICTNLQQQMARVEGTTAAARITPWKRARQLIQSAKL
jgi:uncharacterized protein